MNASSKQLRFGGALLIAFAGGVILAGGLNLTPLGHAQGSPTTTISYNRSGTLLPETSSPFVGIAELVTPSVVRVEAETQAQNTARPNAQNAPNGRPAPNNRRPQQQDPQQLDPNDLFRQFLQPDEPRDMDAVAAGTGFIVSSDGYILTNNHVVTRAGSARDMTGPAADVITVKLNDGRSFRARLVGKDPDTDVAVLKIDETGLPAVVMGDDSKAKIGEWVAAIGDPLDLGITLTAGIISAKGRTTDNRGLVTSVSDFIQTDAAINPGNSGGPLINTKGEVIGINSQIATPTGYSVGYGFAIPITLAKDVMDQLVKYGRVRASVLGVQVRLVEQADAEAAGLRTISGALVAGFPETGPSPAKDAGLQIGDIITKVNGTVIDHVATLQRTVRLQEPGSVVTVEAMRFGQLKTFRVTVREVPTDVAAAAPARRPVPDASPAPAAPASVTKLGVSLGVFTSEPGASSRFQGLVVADVDRDGPAHGILTEDDVIVQILNPGEPRNVRTVAELNTALTQVKSGDYISLYVYHEVPNSPEPSKRVVNIKVGR